MNAIFMTHGGENAIRAAYDAKTQKTLGDTFAFLAPLYDMASIPERTAEMQTVDYIFTTWGMLPLTEAELQMHFPALKAVFYAAGSVQFFARPFLARGIRVFSAFAANAVPVAEYTVAQIVLANKGFYQAAPLYKKADKNAAAAYAKQLPGNFGCYVGIIGAGMIGTLVIERLKSYNLPVMVFDPFLPQEKADRLGVLKCDLPTIFSRCQTISNHLANNEQTRGMLDYDLFRRMRPYATFLNTGRGAQIVEADLVRALREVPTRTAVLDVTDPEPVQPGHPFLTMENVILTPHIAGSLSDEIARMGQYMLAECQALLASAPQKYEVTEAMLTTMA